MTGSAKQSIAAQAEEMDCSVAVAPRNEGRNRSPTHGALRELPIAIGENSGLYSRQQDRRGETDAMACSCALYDASVANQPAAIGLTEPGQRVWQTIARSARGSAIRRSRAGCTRRSRCRSSTSARTARASRRRTTRISAGIDQPAVIDVSGTRGMVERRVFQRDRGDRSAGAQRPGVAGADDDCRADNFIAAIRRRQSPRPTGGRCAGR